MPDWIEKRGRIGEGRALGDTLHMQPLPEPENAGAIRTYEASILEVIRQLTAGMRRVAALVRALDAPGADPELRSMVVAECQSWRAHLDRVPGEPPPVYRPVHIRVVRWSAVVAELGELQIAALTSANPEGQRQVSKIAEQVAARYRDIIEVMERLAAAQRLGADDRSSD